MMRSPRRSDAGFTLVELTITIALMGIIVSALAGAVIVGLRSDASTRGRLAVSADAQFVALAVVPDIQSATDVVAAPTVNTECSGGANLLRLRWTEQISSSAATDTFVAAYRVLFDAGDGQWQLVRSYCANGGAAQTRVVARALIPNCAAPDCAATIAGSRVSLQLTGGLCRGSFDGTGACPNGVDAESVFPYTVSATRRTP